MVLTSLRRRFVILNARFEAYLTTHVFKLLLLIIYIVATCLFFVYGAYDEYHHTLKTIESKHPTWYAFKWKIAVARGTGVALNFQVALSLVLTCKDLITDMYGTYFRQVLPLECLFPDAHIMVGYVTLFLVIIHVPAHSSWLFTYNVLDKFTFGSFAMTLATGILLLLVYLVLIVTSINRFRKKHYHTFLITHTVCGCLMYFLLFFHGMYREKPETFKWILPGLILFAYGRIKRAFKVANEEVDLSGAVTTLKPGNILELRIPKPFKYLAGQYCELSTKVLGKEWHPFTIASSPHEQSIVFYIKRAGDWTRLLYEDFQRRTSELTSEPLRVRIRGPFGAPAQFAGSFRRVILISGGIGATPFASVAKFLHHISTTDVPEHAVSVKKDAEEAEKVDDPLLLERVARTVRTFFLLDSNSSDRALSEQHAQYVAKVLKMRTIQGLTDDVSTEDSEVYMPFDSDIESGDYVRVRRFQGLISFRARVLAYLHSTRLMFFLVLSLIARAALVCIAGIWGMVTFGYFETTLHESAVWIVFADGSLEVLLTLVMSLVVTLEMALYRSKYFSRSGRGLDFLVLVVLSAFSAHSSLYGLESGKSASALTIAQFALLLPLQFILLLKRMRHSTSLRRTLLNIDPQRCGCRCADKVPNVDFLWSVPTNEEDQWLREELAKLGGGSELRLHRFVTREEAVSVDKRISSQSGKPDWSLFFSQIAEKTRSGVDVGVFFCGPRAMGKMIQETLRSVEVRSCLRGTYLSALNDDQLASDFDIDSTRDIKRLRRYGCNVRFVFHEEKF